MTKENQSEALDLVQTVRVIRELYKALEDRMRPYLVEWMRIRDELNCKVHPYYEAGQSLISEVSSIPVVAQMIERVQSGEDPFPQFPVAPPPGYYHLQSPIDASGEEDERGRGVPYRRSDPMGFK